LGILLAVAYATTWQAGGPCAVIDFIANFLTRFPYLLLLALQVIEEREGEERRREEIRRGEREERRERGEERLHLLLLYTDHFHLCFFVLHQTGSYCCGYSE
jgi:hypothetical protein